MTRHLATSAPGDASAPLEVGAGVRASADAGARAWRIVFGVSALSGVAQLAILRELSAAYALSTLGLSIRLMIAVVLAAYGVGAALAPALRGRDAQRCFHWLGVGTALYLLALLAETEH